MVGTPIIHPSSDHILWLSNLPSVPLNVVPLPLIINIFLLIFVPFSTYLWDLDLLNPTSISTPWKYVSLLGLLRVYTHVDKGGWFTMLAKELMVASGGGGEWWKKTRFINGGHTHTHETSREKSIKICIWESTYIFTRKYLDVHKEEEEQRRGRILGCWCQNGVVACHQNTLSFESQL